MPKCKLLPNGEMIHYGQNGWKHCQCGEVDYFEYDVPLEDSRYAGQE